jgi:hypothetical protein
MTGALNWRCRFGEALRSVLRLVGSRQRLSFLWLIAARAMVGFCDLAAAMYLLFLLLLGGRLCIIAGGCLKQLSQPR